MESSGARINEFCVKSCSLEVPAGSLNSPPFPFVSTIRRTSILWCIETALIWAPNLLMDASGLYSQGIVGASSSDSSWLGLPIPMSVPDAKGEDDQRQAHHYRENTDEWR